jgi:hypothetical protein
MKLVVVVVDLLVQLLLVVTDLLVLVLQLLLPQEVLVQQMVELGLVLMEIPMLRQVDFPVAVVVEEEKVFQL